MASGSALAGAAVMATFVIGTMPLFAVIGYAARRSTTYLRGRLGLVTGAVVLVAGLLSINAGLVLNGSSFTLAAVWRDVTGAKAATPVAAPPVAADGVQRILIDAHPTGYTPSSVTARAGVPTLLTLHTQGNEGCTRTLVLTSFGGGLMGTPGNLVFAVTGMHCASCGLLIDDAVEELEGVKRCQTDARRGRTVVTADPEVATVDAIVAAIVEAGYQAEAVAG